MEIQSTQSKVKFMYHVVPTTLLDFEQYRLIPGEDRGTPATLEFIMTLPPNSVTIFTVQVKFF